MKRYLALFCLILLLGGCSGEEARQAQGYIEGKYTYMATSVSGVLKKILVEKGARVKQGQLLLALEDQPESDIYTATVQNLNEAQAARDAIAANLTYAKLTFERYKKLVPKNAIQQSALDNAKSIYEATIAQLAQASATIESTSAKLAQTKWTLEQKRLYAPVDAIVFDRYYRIGEYTEANKPIVSLLSPRDIKVIFFIPEGDLSRIRLGDKVDVRCDGCKEPYPGKISFISPSAEYTPPVIYSTETNQKLIFRIEANFTPEIAYQLHPGQPVYVTYYQHHDQ